VAGADDPVDLDFVYVQNRKQRDQDRERDQRSNARLLAPRAALRLGRRLRGSLRARRNGLPILLPTRGAMGR
jgi:hypothetical protein